MSYTDTNFDGFGLNAGCDCMNLSFIFLYTLRDIKSESKFERVKVDLHIYIFTDGQTVKQFKQVAQPYLFS